MADGICVLNIQCRLQKKQAMTGKDFQKKDSFWRNLIEKTNFLRFVANVSIMGIPMVVTLLLRNSKLFLIIYRHTTNEAISAYLLIYACLLLSLQLIIMLMQSSIIPFFKRTYSKFSYTCMLNRICYLPLTVEEMEKYHTSGLEQLLLLILKMESYMVYDQYYFKFKLRPVLPDKHIIGEKNEQLYKNIKTVFKEDFDNNGFLKKYIRNTVHTFLCEETDIDKKSITSFLDHLDAGKDF